MTALAFADTETTGLDPERHEIWEVALLLADSDDLSDTTENVWQLPVDLTRADPIALSIGGYHDRHPSGYGTASDPGAVHNPHLFAHEFAHLTYQAHLVGAVPSFDDERLRKLLARWGFAPGWHYHLIDVEAMAVGWLHGQAYEGWRWDDSNPRSADVSLPWRSDDLSRACGVEPPGEEERHTALGDARFVYRLYKKLVGAE